VINAQTLDLAGNIVNFNNALVVPTIRTSFNPRFDFQLNDTNTLVVRYSFSRNAEDNQGLNEFTLPTRAFITRSANHNIQLTETAILNATTINETRFQFVRSDSRNEGDNSIPAINVSGAFNGGGAQIGLQQNVQNRWEFQNYTTWTTGNQNLKAGIRLRGIRLDNFSQQNFGGTFIFAGVQAVRDPNNPNVTLSPAISSIEQYRARVLGNTDPRFNPTQFTITSGDPQVNVSQYDAGIFITDDWRVRPDLTLSFGLRYENQNNISSNYNFAPRFGFAWSPGAGGARPPKTVFRGGAGIFYDRFGENNFLQTARFNGQLQQSYIVTDPILLSQVTFAANGTVSNAPTIAQIAASAQAQPNTIFQTNPDFEAARISQGLFSVERQLPFKITLATTYIFAQTNNVQLTRNINAPVCPPLQPCVRNTAQFPLQTRNNIYEYNSIGKTVSHILNFNFRTNLNPKYTFFGNYRIGSFRGNTDGGFPLYSYDLSFDENDRLSTDVRHNLFFGGSFTAPWGVQLRPTIVASSGRPFNITTGFDNNGDTIFNDRPALATDLSRSSVVQTRFGNFDLQPIAGQTIIPRNYGEGPAFFNVNLGITKNFGFGKTTRSAAQNRSADSQTAQNTGGDTAAGLRGIGGGRGQRGGGGGRGGRGGGGFNGVNSDKPYNLSVGVNIQNLFNRTNLAVPIGNLSSPFFGRSISTVAGFFGPFGGAGGFGGTNAGNRRIEMQLRFSF
jgi:hypothetical protein